MSIYEDNQSANLDATEPALEVPEWPPRRRELLKWFQTEARSLAPAYEAAVRLVNMPSFPAREHLVGHVVRDIYDKLPEIMHGEYRRKPYGGAIRSFVDRVESAWKTTDVLSTASSGPEAAPTQTADRIEIPWKAVQAVESLLHQHRHLNRQESPSEILARTLCARYAEAGLERPARLMKHFKDERQWFLGRAHVPNDERKRRGDEGLEERFESFEDALYSLVGQYFAGKKEIDDILAKANKRAD